MAEEQIQTSLTPTRQRKGRDYLSQAQWDDAYERYAQGWRLDDVYDEMPEPKQRSFKAFQNAFYIRRKGLEERFAARRREFRLSEPFEKFHVRHRRGAQFEILGLRKSGNNFVFGPMPMQEAHWIAGRLNA